MDFRVANLLHNDSRAGRMQGTLFQPFFLLIFYFFSKSLINICYIQICRISFCNHEATALPTTTTTLVLNWATFNYLFFFSRFESLPCEVCLYSRFEY